MIIWGLAAGEFNPIAWIALGVGAILYYMSGNVPAGNIDQWNNPGNF